MTFSVGILYSSHEFLEFAKTNALTAEQFARERRFVLSSPEAILEVAQNCNWIQLTVDGKIRVTERGEKIIGAIEPALKLRLQLEDLISFHDPPWASKIQHGREEALVAMPNDVRQCFEECGLLDRWDSVLIGWWDAAALLARTRRSERLSRTGRTAEQWTFDYESGRTGYPPEWICLDSSYAGYDVLSRLSNSDPTPVPIEVKGSERRPKEADFVITRNEYRAAQGSTGYVLHLWYVSSTRHLYIVPFEEVAKHLPTDRGEGRWENARVPYAPFATFRRL